MGGSRWGLAAAACALVACGFDPSVTAPGSDPADSPDAAAGTADAAPGAIDADTATTFRRTITIAAPSLPDAPAQMPIAIAMTGDAGLIAHARADGADLLFTLTDGTTLPFEIERLDTGAGDLLAWVKLPAIQSGQTDIHLYYGSDTPLSSTAAEVWKDVATTVWHFGDASGASIADSSGSDNDGSAASGEQPQIAAAIFASGADFDAGDVVEIPSTSALDPGSGSFTVSLLFRQQSTVGGGRDMAFYRGACCSQSSRGFDFELGTGNWFANVGDGSNVRQAAFGSETSLAGDWHHLALVVDRNADEMYAYLDGSVQSTIGIGSMGSVSASIQPRIGHSSMSLDGIVDEFRFYPSARTAGWIRIEATNAFDPGFVTIGPEQPATYPGG